jgi:uroporphyrinogen-III decarboxylase
LAQAGVTLLWHCDGNVTPMVQPMLECGLQGFQGFQYEDGVDYERICRMKDRNGEPLFIIAGVSVTRTLPHGTPDDVRKEMRWLVEHGPRRGLVLGCSSSMPPGVPWENLRALTEGFWHYRTRGRE